ncbi:hypothetical protein HZA96_00285 [Candidatus Woesearchaeota archaeon]|nr:hypothetical protein [Candidatus Woesearchaeota archaeon]
MNSPELYITEETLQKVYEQHKGTLTQFIKHILGLYKFPDSQQRIEEDFKKFIVAHNKVYTADQINFLRALMTVFSKKKHIEYHDFFEPPFTNFGTHAPTPLFSEEQLKEMVELCNQLEKELFAST